MDILSGTYSRMDQDMAGTFQVLWGSEDGFRVAEELNGTDDEPLIIPATEDEMLEKICTRPFACDIDADGDLDLIVGNFGGTFYQFTGEGEGKFQPEPEQLLDSNGKNLLVPNHSDPFMFDWDSDGDLDLISGSNAGGVAVAINNGSEKVAKFDAFKLVFKGIKGRNFNQVVLGDDHIKGPQSATRVWIDDINGDGKFDILVGDSVTVSTLGEGVKEDEFEDLLSEWEKEQASVTEGYAELFEKYEAAAIAVGTEDESEESKSEESETDTKPSKQETELEKLQEEMNAYQEKMQAVFLARQEIVKDDMTGFVWVYYQK